MEPAPDSPIPDTKTQTWRGLATSVCYFPVCVPGSHVQFVSSLPVLAASITLFSVLYRNGVFVRGLRAVTFCLAGMTLVFGVMFTLEYYHAGSLVSQREALIHEAVRQGNLVPLCLPFLLFFNKGIVLGTDVHWWSDLDPSRRLGICRRFDIRRLAVKEP